MKILILKEYNMAWKYFDHNPAENANNAPDAGRTLARTVARGGEAILGLPGDILSTGLSVGNFVTGGNIPGVETVQKYLPTSANIRKGTEALTGEYLKPRNKGEEFYEDVVGDLATLALPVKGKIPFKSAIVKALGANALGFLGEEVGGDIGKSVGKIGFILGSGLPGGKSKLEEAMKVNYKKAGESIKDNPIFKSKPLRDEVTQLQKWSKSGIGTPEKEFVGSTIDSVKKLIKKDTISIKNAWEAKKDVNSLLKDKNTPTKALPQLEKLSGSLNKVLQEYGTKYNPDFLKSFNFSEDIYKGLNKKSKINKFFQDNFSLEELAKNSLTKGLLGTIAYGTGQLPKLAAGAVAGFGARPAIQSFEFLMNSKEAQKYYKDILKGAASGNKTLVARSITNLNKVGDHYEKKNNTSNNEWQYFDSIPS